MIHIRIEPINDTTVLIRCGDFVKLVKLVKDDDAST